MKNNVQVVIKNKNGFFNSIKNHVKSFLGFKPDPAVIVGYTAQYAIYVHENLEANHPNGGQAKYLEQPAREMQAELAQIVKDRLNRGQTLEQALYVAGLKLQGESQKLVPVDTGNLRASAFTRIKE